MSSPRFFVSSEKVKEGKILIQGNDFKHIRDVLRLRVGNELIVSNGLWEYQAKIEKFEKDKVVAEVLKSQRIIEALPKIALFQGYPKGKKFEFILKKGTELGADLFCPVIFERTVPKIEKDKLSRWRRIVLEASKQCQRPIIPEVYPPLSFSEACEVLSDYEKVIIFWEKEKKKSLKTLLKGEFKQIALVIGPEGGLKEEEVEKLVRLGGEKIGLGNAILRTETASMVALILVLYEVGRIG